MIILKASSRVTRIFFRRCISLSAAKMPAGLLEVPPGKGIFSKMMTRAPPSAADGRPPNRRLRPPRLRHRPLEPGPVFPDRRPGIQGRDPPGARKLWYLFIFPPIESPARPPKGSHPGKYFLKRGLVTLHVFEKGNVSLLKDFPEIPPAPLCKGGLGGI